MDNVLEKQRAAHEDIERLEQAIVDQFMQETKTHRERLWNQHTVDKFLTRIVDKSQQLHDMYEDKTGLRQSEIEALSGSSEFSEFYERLRVIKDHHRKYPNEPVEPPEMEFIFINQKRDQGDDEELEKLFSGEENFGRYLDLNTLYTEYVNLKGVRKMDYLQFLSEFDKFEAVYPKNIKMSEPYRNYLDHFKQYLYSFFRRANPLYNLTELEEKAKRELDENWAAGKIPGWEEVATDDADESLFCVACQKKFAKQSVYDAHLKGKKHIKAQKALEENQSPNGNGGADAQANGHGREDKRKAVAWKEILISKYAEALSDFLAETRANIERKQALTDKERTLEQDQDEIDIADQDSDEDDEDKIYNPLKLPLGWDGKPIPYWLYKLHGLGVEYPCEICGNYVYMGRKAFDKHFQEWRHAHGMRCLGIPNTRHFHEITKIDDAYALYQKLKKEGQTEDPKADTMEEYEDSEGNVYNKKTYEDLKRQGII
ncbi:uncharacterized protein BYT42DRAFT_598546 [Radiomyces spectabilis]|uniref:uncharacterized protein n=1 Tax=Radiomyces spectabilis TaxID=64574 RepID=UPI00221FAB3E|nr:uncharacterized protein BYT42DRAFT_598546 [Radiomyces spectabilis]KAI8379558.1 hypothetical protein BYT42DRAFT_598546 [Radiomyces spectabilis]